MLNRPSLKTVSRVTHLLITILMIVNLTVLAGLPWIVRTVISIDLGAGYVSILARPALYRYFLLLLYAAGLLAFFILTRLRRIFQSCVRQEVFVKDNVNHLLHLSVATLLVSLLFLSKVFFINSIMTMVVVFIFFMASVFCLVLAQVFEEAVRYKTENDLTV